PFLALLINHFHVTLIVLFTAGVQLIASLSLSDIRNRIWIVGSSLVKRAFLHARRSFEGSQLGLSRYHASVWWQGKGGLRWRELEPFIRHLLTVEDIPQILVIHCGGNDIGQCVSCGLRHAIVKTLHKLMQLLPDTIFVWSQILPRLEWRNEIVHEAVERVRPRVNSKVASYLTGLGGKYITYPELQDCNPEFFVDKVHLSNLGNDIFLYHVQQDLCGILANC
ncbi:uncharacterized protein LOC117341555, partial [Pecten maximus]|uniref:uncharacterized protein LOC117341555 n=1 Tax=Pecten maximus TaxID=6579 RepID=UPI001459114D